MALLFLKLQIITLVCLYFSFDTPSFVFRQNFPTHSAFPSLGYAFENFVNMYSLVFTETQWCAINEAYTRAFAQENLLDKQG